MPKRTVSDRLQSLEPGSEAAGRKRAASKATATPLSPASQRAFAVLTEAGLQDKFISPDESNERNPKRSKAEKRDCKRKRKLNNEYWCGKAEPPEQPPPPQPERVEARHKRPEQDKVHAVPKHTTRSTHSAFKQASDDYIGRRVAWTSEKGRWAGEATVVEANEWGEHLLRRRDGEEVWVDLAECLQSKELKFVYVGCGCPGIVDGLCERDLKARRVYPSTAKVKVTTFDGLDSVMVTGNRMLPSGLLEEVRTTADNMLNVTIAKHGGNKGGKDALVKRYTDHGSPLCARCGTCYGNGTAEREVDGETVCVPASRVSSYGAQYSEQAWSDVRHIPPAVADVTRRAYNVLLPNLSEATKECGAFNSIQIRVYDGTQKTGEHTDTRVACDKRTGEPKSTKLPNQIEDTDTIILSIGDSMLLRRKVYPGGNGKYRAWVDPDIELKHGSLLVWRSKYGDLDCDDWFYKHAVHWPKTRQQPGFVDKPKKLKRRIAIVMRCVRGTAWHETQLPYRVVDEAPPSR